MRHLRLGDIVMPPRKPPKPGKPPTAKKAKKPEPKETSDNVSAIAARVLAKGKATQKEALTLAGSALAQDQTKGKRKHP